MKKWWLIALVIGLLGLIGLVLVGSGNTGSYINSSGHVVSDPVYSSTAPAGATAHCRDGSYSFSQHRQGTCSHHGGVDSWL